MTADTRDRVRPVLDFKIDPDNPAFVRRWCKHCRVWLHHNVPPPGHEHTPHRYSHCHDPNCETFGIEYTIRIVGRTGAAA